MTNEKPKKEKVVKEKTATGKEVFNRSRIIVGIIIMIVAVVAVALAMTVFTKKSTSVLVLRARADIADGTLVTESNANDLFYTYETNDNAFASNECITATNENVAALYGKYVVGGLREDDFIKARNFSDIAVLKTDVVPEGKQLVGMHISSIEADVGYMPKAGDIIRFYGLRGDQAYIYVMNGRLVNRVGSEAFVYDLLQNVEIYSCLDGDGLNTATTNGNPSNMVLILTEAQTKQLIEAQAAGSIYLSLISSGDPVAKERLLKEQQIVEDTQAMLAAMVDSPEREEVTVPYQLVTALTADGEEYLPEQGDVVKFVYADTVERQRVGLDGKVSVEKITSTVTPELLACVRVADFYRENGTSLSLSEANETPEEREEAIKNGYMGLELTEEQLDELLSLVKKQLVCVVKIEDPEEDVENAFLEVDAAIRRARIAAYENEQGLVIEESSESK